MATNSSNSWWDNYRETVKITKRFRELVSYVDNREDVARNMISVAKSRYPGKNELWYLNKLVAEQRKTNTLGIWSEA